MKAFAYLADHDLRYLKPEDFNSEKVLERINISRVDMTPHGWIKVGDVEVDLTLLPTDTIVGNAVKALRIKQAELRAKASKECNDIEGQLQQLLCIENNPTITPQPKYVVDGTDDHGNLAGDGQNAPFVIFNIDTQEAHGHYKTRDEAQTYCDHLNNLSK